MTANQLYRVDSVRQVLLVSSSSIRNGLHLWSISWLAYWQCIINSITHFFQRLFVYAVCILYIAFDWRPHLNKYIDNIAVRYLNWYSTCLLILISQVQILFFVHLKIVFFMSFPLCFDLCKVSLQIQCMELFLSLFSCHSVCFWIVCYIRKSLKEHVALDRSSWSLESVCNRLL